MRVRYRGPNLYLEIARPLVQQQQQQQLRPWEEEKADTAAGITCEFGAEKPSSPCAPAAHSSPSREGSVVGAEAPHVGGLGETRVVASAYDEPSPAREARADGAAVLDPCDGEDTVIVDTPPLAAACAKDGGEKEGEETEEMSCTNSSHWEAPPGVPEVLVRLLRAETAAAEPRAARISGDDLELSQGVDGGDQERSGELAWLTYLHHVVGVCTSPSLLFALSDPSLPLGKELSGRVGEDPSRPADQGHRAQQARLMAELTTQAEIRTVRAALRPWPVVAGAPDAHFASMRPHDLLESAAAVSALIYGGGVDASPLASQADHAPDRDVCALRNETDADASLYVKLPEVQPTEPPSLQEAPSTVLRELAAIASSSGPSRVQLPTSASLSGIMDEAELASMQGLLTGGRCPAPAAAADNASNESQKQIDIRSCFHSVLIPTSSTLEEEIALGGGDAIEEPMLPAPLSATHLCDELAGELLEQAPYEGGSQELRSSGETRARIHEMYQELLLCEDTQCPFTDNSPDCTFKMMPACLPADSWRPCTPPPCEMVARMHLKPRNMTALSMYLDWELSETNGTSNSPNANAMLFQELVMKDDCKSVDVLNQLLPTLPLLEIIASPLASPGSRSGGGPIHAVSPSEFHNRLPTAPPQADSISAPASGRTPSACPTKQPADGFIGDLNFFQGLRKRGALIRGRALTPRGAAGPLVSQRPEEDAGNQRRLFPPAATRATGVGVEPTWCEDDVSTEVHALDLPLSHGALLATLTNDHHLLVTACAAGARVARVAPTLDPSPARRALLARASTAVQLQASEGRALAAEAAAVETAALLAQVASALLHYGVRVAALEVAARLQRDPPVLREACARSTQALRQAAAVLEAGAAVDDHPKLAALRAVLAAAVAAAAAPSSPPKVLLLSDSAQVFFALLPVIQAAGLRAHQLGQVRGPDAEQVRTFARARTQLTRSRPRRHARSLDLAKATGVAGAVERALVAGDVILATTEQLLQPGDRFPIHLFKWVVQYTEGTLDPTLTQQAAAFIENFGLYIGVTDWHVLRVNIPADLAPAPSVCHVGASAIVGQGLDTLPPPCAKESLAAEGAEDGPHTGEPPGLLATIVVNRREHGAVANGQEPQEEVGSPILTRRHLYESILRLERQNAQVVERNSAEDLPHLVFACPHLTTAVVVLCGQHALELRHTEPAEARQAASEDGGPCHPAQSNVTRAHSLMKRLSLAFSAVVVVLEGTSEPDSILPILEASTSVAVAAQHLGLRLWIFVAASPSHTQCLLTTFLTSNIRYAALHEGSRMEPMPADPVPAEDFLSSFVGLHPVSAHLLLCLQYPLTQLLTAEAEDLAQHIEHRPFAGVVPLSCLRLFCEQSRSGQAASMPHCMRSLGDAHQPRTVEAYEPHATDTQQQGHPRGVHAQFQYYGSKDAPDRSTTYNQLSRVPRDEGQQAAQGQPVYSDSTEYYEGTSEKMDEIHAGERRWSDGMSGQRHAHAAPAAAGSAAAQNQSEFYANQPDYSYPVNPEASWAGAGRVPTTMAYPPMHPMHFMQQMMSFMSQMAPGMYGQGMQGAGVPFQSQPQGGWGGPAAWPGDTPPAAPGPHYEAYWSNGHRPNGTARPQLYATPAPPRLPHSAYGAAAAPAMATRPTTYYAEHAADQEVEEITRGQRYGAAELPMHEMAPGGPARGARANNPAPDPHRRPTPHHSTYSERVDRLADSEADDQGQDPFLAPLPSCAEEMFNADMGPRLRDSTVQPGILDEFLHHKFGQLDRSPSPPSPTSALLPERVHRRAAAGEYRAKQPRAGAVLRPTEESGRKRRRADASGRTWASIGLQDDRPSPSPQDRGRLEVPAAWPQLRPHPSRSVDRGLGVVGAPLYV